MHRQCSAQLTGMEASPRSGWRALMLDSGEGQGAGGLGRRALPIAALTVAMGATNSIDRFPWPSIQPIVAKVSNCRRDWEAPCAAKRALESGGCASSASHFYYGERKS